MNPLHCGADRGRTDDLLVANQALSQLSYSPIACSLLLTTIGVGLSGVEPLTSRLSGVRSNQLSYRPIGSKLMYGFQRTKKRKVCTVRVNKAGQTLLRFGHDFRRDKSP